MQNITFSRHCDDYCLMVDDALQSGRNLSTFRRSLLPLFFQAAGSSETLEKNLPA